MTFQEFSSHFSETATYVAAAKPASTAVAIGALSSPVWLETLRASSEVAGLLLPFAGILWLVVQMVTHFTRKKK